MHLHIVEFNDFMLNYHYGYEYYTSNSFYTDIFGCGYGCGIDIGILYPNNGNGLGYGDMIVNDIRIGYLRANIEQFKYLRVIN